MKFKTSKENLNEGIQIVQNVVSPKATLPILSNMLMEAQNGRLKLNTTDLDIGISCEVAVDVLEEGALTVPAKKFSDIARELPAGDVVITTRKNNQIDIEGENCHFKLVGLPKEEFPKFPEFKDKSVVRIEQGMFKEILRMTMFAVSHEESRYILNGILMEISGNTIKAIATDGRRLAKMERELASPAKDEISVILPIKAVSEIFRNLKEEGEIAFMTGTNQVMFDIDGVLVVTRIIDGEFPNYNQVIPEAEAKTIGIARQEFLSAIRRANLLATPDFQAIKLELFKDKMIVSKTTPDVGESREEIPVVYGGSELIVGFNPQFLIDVLKNISEEKINLELLGADKPGLIRQKDYLYLALPMRI